MLCEFISTLFCLRCDLYKAWFSFCQSSTLRVYFLPVEGFLALIVISLFKPQDASLREGDLNESCLSFVSSRLKIKLKQVSH